MYTSLGAEICAGWKQVWVRDNNIVNNIVKHLRAASSWIGRYINITYYYKTVNYWKLLKRSCSPFETGRGLIQQLKKYTVFRNSLFTLYIQYKCIQTNAKIINEYFTKWCTIKFIMIWSCLCCAESSGCETGHIHRIIYC